MHCLILQKKLTIRAPLKVFGPVINCQEEQSCKLVCSDAIEDLRKEEGQHNPLQPRNDNPPIFVDTHVSSSQGSLHDNHLLGIPNLEIRIDLFHLLNNIV
jgi:hypothetical protein